MVEWITSRVDQSCVDRDYTSAILIGTFMIYTWFVNYVIVYFFIISLIILAKSPKLNNYSTSLYVIKLLGNVMCNRTCIIVYRIRLYVYETCKYHEPVT